MADGVTHDELQRLVPAALEEDLLEEVAAEAHRAEVVDLLRGGAYPDDDLAPLWECAACARSDTPLSDDGVCAPDAGGCRSPEPDDEDVPLTPAQALGLVEHVLGARRVDPDAG